MTSSAYGAFAHAYMAQVKAAVGSMLENGGAAAAALMKVAIADGRGVRGYGNGGSSAIVRAVLAQMRAGHAGLDVNESMMSPSALAYAAQRHGYPTVFSGALLDEISGRGSGVGLVVLASVSGRSRNIVEAVRLCRSHGVPVLAAVGGRGDQLGPVYGMVWATGTTDQQVSEDAMLTALTLATAATAELESTELATGLREYEAAVDALDTRRLGQWMEAATRAVAGAVRDRKSIYVLCPDGGPLALAAEHFAHNLHWDAPLGVAGVRPPVVLADPSLADLSAIYNDHPDPAHSVRYQLDSASPGDVVFLLAYDATSRTSQQAADAAIRAGARLFVLHRDGAATPAGNGASIFSLPPLDDFAAPCLVQSIAHLVCRTTRATLAGPTPQGAGQTVLDLMSQDLAPLRELSPATTSPTTPAVA